MALIKQKVTSAVNEEERSKPRDCESLEKQLGHADPMVRRWAARDLAECSHAAPALVACLRNEADLSVREIILSALTHLGDAVAIAGLVDCLRSEDAGLRNQAIEVMKLLPTEVAPIMRSLLDDQDADVRIFAVNILESLRHPQVEDWLIDVISTDDNINVCATALDLLGEVGSKASFEALTGLKLRFAEEPYIQFAVDLALKRLA